MKDLEAFIKSVLQEDLSGFLRDTSDTHYSEYSDDDAVKAGGKHVKRAWAKNADRDFIQSLIKVHWIQAPSIAKFQKLMSASGKDELSVGGFLPGSTPKSGWSNVGVIVDGYVTLAANNMDAIYSGFMQGKEKDPKQGGSGMTKRAMVFKPGLARQYILDRSSFDPSVAGHNELLIDNWKVSGLIVPIDANGKMKATNADKKLFVTMAQMIDDKGLPIYDSSMNKRSLIDVMNSIQM